MKKILVLEDEPSIRSFVVINLRRSGYEPIEAATGEEALEKLAQPAYDPALAQEDLVYVAKKLGLTKAEFEGMMRGPNKTYADYRNQAGMIAAAVKAAQLVGMEKRNYR